MSRHKTNDIKTFNYDLSPFMPQNMNRSISFQNDSIETLREKLQIKSEALNLLAKQIEICNKEKFDHKRLIDTLYDKNLSLKKSLYFKENEAHEENSESFFGIKPSLTYNSLSLKQRKSNNKVDTDRFLNIPLFNKHSPNESTNSLFSDTESEDYMKILKDLVKTLQKEKYELKQKYEDCEQQLIDSRSDLRLLREQIVRQRVGSLNEGLTFNTPDSNSSVQISTPVIENQTSNQSNCFNSRENLIKEIEQLKEQKQQLECELNLSQCLQEEIEIERDSFKAKYNQLNEFLAKSCMNQNRQQLDADVTDEATREQIVLNKRLLINKSMLSLNIDDLISQNKYLNESNRNLKNEIDMMKKAKRSLGNKNELNLVLNDSNAINKKYIEHLLGKAESFLNENSSVTSSSFEIVCELKNLIESFIESLNDKLIANVHQRKVNKMLATRIQDLENQLSFYFNNKKNGNEANFSSSLVSNEVDTSLNESLEHQLPMPLKPLTNVKFENTPEKANTNLLVNFSN